MPRPIQIDDLARLKYVSDPRISPDGRRIAYIVTEMDLPGKRYRSAVWIASSEDGESRPFTSSSGKDTAPRWSPDGTQLAFLSDRSGTTQLHVIPSDGGEARQISDLKHGVADPLWSPDGSWIAVTSKLGPEGIVVLAEQSDAERAREREQSDVRVIRSLKYKRDGEGFVDDRRRHVVLIPAAGGPPRRLTQGDWDGSQIAWSPSGDRIAFASNRTDERERNTVSDIWLVAMADGAAHQVTRSDGEFGSPSFSPDGSLIAFFGHRFSERYGPNTIDGLWVASSDGGVMRELTAGLDRWVGNTCTSDAHYTTPDQRPVWMPSGDALLVPISDRGNVPVIRIGLDGTSSVIVGGEREVVNLDAGSELLTFTVSSATQPLEAAVCHLDGHDERQISHANDSLLAEVTLSQPERLVYAAEGDVEIDAWVLKPPGFNPTRRYPLILTIHGGPHAMFGNAFVHEFQVLAACDHVVLYCNPRGSTDRGQAFAAAAMGDWGGIDYRDLMHGVDRIVNEPYVDAARLGVIGGSYGGYMTNWIITQSDRFRAAVTERSTCNRHNLVGTSDLVWSYTDWEFGRVDTDREFYLERSPLSHVANVTAPLLILHSELDYRCPIEQAEQLFVALKLHGKEAEFVRFPDESHGLSRTGRPDHRIERLERITQWFERHL